MLVLATKGLLSEMPDTPLSLSGGGSERNVWQGAIACRSLVLNSAYQVGVIVLLMVVLLPPTVKVPL